MKNVDLYTFFRKNLLSFVRPVENSTYSIFDPFGTKLLNKLWQGFSHPWQQKFRQVFRHCEPTIPCSLEIESTEHYFLRFFEIASIFRTTLLDELNSTISLLVVQIAFTFYLFCTLFTADLKLLIYTKKSLYSLYSYNIELIDVNSVTEQEMQSFPKEFLKSMWTSYQTHTHLFTHCLKKHSKERLYSCVVSFLVFTV